MLRCSSLSAHPSTAAGSRAALLALMAAAVLGGCRGQGGTFAPRPDSGTEVLTCNSTADCNGRGICMSGVCEAVTSCTNDDQCKADGKVCHTRRFYCVQCDGTHADECPAGQTCQFDFTCVTIGSADGGVTDGSACTGSCTDRTSCGPDQVCSAGACCPPPARCFSVADCPSSRPECNGATGACFGGDSCVADNDCETRPGCAGGACVCNRSTGACSTRPDECQSDADCWSNGSYAGKVCTISTPPKRCVNAPSCTSDADCAPSGLVCDLTPGSPSLNKCKNGTLCPMGTECDPATEKCLGGVCVRKNCLNSPELCNATQRCDATTAMCVANQTGSCMRDADCSADRYCNLPTGAGMGSCMLGCRDSSGCPSNQVCDANHQCQASQGGVCGACTTDADCPGGTSCVDVLGTSRCYEPCSTITGQMCTLRPGAQCLFGKCSCLL